LNRTTTESIISHMLQDLSPTAWYQLTSKPQARSQRCPGSPTPSRTEKILESWVPGAPSCLAWSR